MKSAIIEMSAWINTPAGIYLNRLEQAWFDTHVENIFGFHALQLGFSGLQTLRQSRMPRRWFLDEWVSIPNTEAIHTTADQILATPQLQALFEALPLGERSIDLATCPHTLELCQNAHATLREIHRILVPEGKLLLTAFNPASLWGFAHKRSCLYMHLGLSSCLLPIQQAATLSPRRLRDWLRLLGFEIENTYFLGYRPAFQSGKMLQKSAFLESIGARCWRFWGAIYAIKAIKRQPNMRLTGIDWKHQRTHQKPFLRPVATPSNSQRDYS